MHHFRTNPPSRLIPPRPALLPSEKAHRVYSDARHRGRNGRTGGEQPSDITARLNRLERLCSDRDLSPSAVGRAINSDPRLIFDMRDGRNLRDRTLAKIDAFLARQEAAHA